jgi:hypothetical protein
MERIPCSDSETIIEYCSGNLEYGVLDLKTLHVVGQTTLKPPGAGTTFS